MKNAFSMVELIFIIVLMGILAKVASSYMPDNRLLNDTNYISMKIKEQQRNAIGYDSFKFGNSQYWTVPTPQYSKDFNLTCIDINATYLENLDNEKSYKLTSKVKTTPNPIFCFDSIGRPYVDSNLSTSKIDINITYNDKNSTISVLPISGYVIIK